MSKTTLPLQLVALASLLIAGCETPPIEEIVIDRRTLPSDLGVQDAHTPTDVISPDAAQDMLDEDMPEVPLDEGVIARPDQRTRDQDLLDEGMIDTMEGAPPCTSTTTQSCAVWVHGGDGEWVRLEPRGRELVEQERYQVALPSEDVLGFAMRSDLDALYVLTQAATPNTPHTLLQCALTTGECSDIAIDINDPVVLMGSGAVPSGVLTMNSFGRVVELDVTALREENTIPLGAELPMLPETLGRRASSSTILPTANVTWTMLEDEMSANESTLLARYHGNSMLSFARLERPVIKGLAATAQESGFWAVTLGGELLWLDAQSGEEQVSLTIQDPSLLPVRAMTSAP